DHQEASAEIVRVSHLAVRDARQWQVGAADGLGRRAGHAQELVAPHGCPRAGDGEARSGWGADRLVADAAWPSGPGDSPLSVRPRRAKVVSSSRRWDAWWKSAAQSASLSRAFRRG